MLLPSTATLTAGSGRCAGPLVGLPSLMLKWLPWNGQTICPLSIEPTGLPWWVQTAEKPLNWPAAGCVTTTFASVKILPPPTGTSDTGPRTVPPLALDGGAELVPLVGS